MRSFEHQKVDNAAAALTGHRPALTAALVVDPAEYAIGDRVYLVMEATVAKVTHSWDERAAELTRLHTLAAGTAAFVDQALVKDVLEEQRERIEQAQGITRLDFGGDE